jgi:hypothetical protein
MPRRTSPWILLAALSACPAKPNAAAPVDAAPEPSAAPIEPAERPSQAAPTGAMKARPSPTIWAGESGGVRIEWSEQALVARPPGGKPVDLFEKGKKEEGCEGEQAVRVLSVVGSIVSYEEFEGISCEGAAHPSSYTFYVAVDAAHPGSKPRLTDFFTDADVLRALLADPIVKRHAPKPSPKTTDALVQALSSENTECEYAFSADLLNRFAFHHVEGQKVAVRLGLSHGCEAARGRLTQLGILLPVPPALFAPLERASKRAEGFLARDQASVAASRETRLRF